MKTIRLAFLILFSILSTFIYSQCNLPYAPVTIFEEEVPLFCNGIDAFCSQLPPSYTQQDLPGCDVDYFIVDNAHMISFVAGSEELTIKIVPFDCSFTDFGFGIQAALYEELNPFFEDSEAIVAECGSSNDDPIFLEANNLKIGNLYYLLIDGFGGSECLYFINVEEGSTKAPVLDQIPEIYGPDAICSGKTYQFSASSEFGCKFIWTINGEIIQDYFDSTISVTVEDENSFIISARTTNNCHTSPPNFLFEFDNDYTEIDSVQTDEFCQGTSYSFGSMTFTQPGVYDFIDTVQCDIISFELNLLEILGSDTMIMEEICTGGCLIHSGIEICEAGTYTNTYIGANGCDSIVTIVVEQLSAPVGLDVGEFCTGGSFLWNDVEYTEPGLYEVTIELSDGCDSIAQLQLQVLPPLSSTLNASICVGESYIWNGMTYTMSGIYELEFSTAENCDSMAILNLNVITTDMGFDSDSLCEGEIYTWNDMEYTDSGNYTALLTSSQGCDSIAVLNLTVLERDSIYMDVEICSGDVYVFDGIEYDSEVMVENNYTNTSGCDSIRVLNLEVLPLPMIDIDAEICASDTFFYGGDFYTIPGNYQILLASSDVCDTILTLDLVVLDTFYNEMTVGIVSGEEFNNVVITKDTVFKEVFQAENSCDSTVITNVNVITSTKITSEGTTFSIFPNPTNDFAIISFKDLPSDQIKVQVIDVQGQLIFQDVHIGKREITLDLSEYSTGLYVLIVEEEGSVTVERIIKE